MKQCDYFLKKLADGSYNAMSGSEKNDFRLELKKYPGCEKVFEKMENSIQSIKNKKVPDPGAEYWNSFFNTLEPKLHKKNNSHRMNWNSLLRIAALFLGGIFTGYLIFNLPSEIGTIAENSTDAKQVALYDKTSEVLEDSKMLLLGIVNLDGSTSTDKIDFSFQKEISRNLIIQTADLKKQLEKSKNKRVISLLNDLNLILMQIANIEETFDLQAIKIIQDGADKQSLLFKINMEKLLLNAREEHQKEISQKQNL